MRPIVRIYTLGRTSYIKALNIQHVLSEHLKEKVSPSNGYSALGLRDNYKTLFDDRSKELYDINSFFNTGPDSTSYSTSPRQCPSNSLLLLEHEPVYTVGLRAQLYNQDYVIKLKEKLAQNNLKAEFVRTNRGGLITFHGHGQLVAYPIIYLGDFKKTIPNRSVRAYVNKLEDAIIDTLAMVGVHGAHTVREHPGVWLGNGERKIAFVGISCKRYVTMHGISINCDCDLTWFDHIVSCGIEDKTITSVQQELLIKKKPPIESYKYSCKEDEKCTATMVHDDIDPHADDWFHTNKDRLKCMTSGDNSKFSPKYCVQNVANAFCSSFSHHFDCELLER